MSSSERFSTLVWLIPDQRNRPLFQSIIDRLAEQYDGPGFEPHLTLGKISDWSEDKKIEGGPIELEATGIFISPVFTKTLFVRFALSAALQSMRSSLGMNAEGYDPHLSLLYCDLPVTEQQRLAATVSLPPGKVRFDRLSVFRCPDPTKTKADVGAWERVSSMELKGA